MKQEKPLPGDRQPAMPADSGLVRVGYAILIAITIAFGAFLYVFNATNFF